MTDNILKKVSEEERLQNLRESREMAMMQISWEKQNARERGYAEGHAEGLSAGHAQGLAAGHAQGHAQGCAEGRAEGRAEGEAQATRKMAGKLKSMGLSIEQIIEATGLTEKEVKKL